MIVNLCAGVQVRVAFAVVTLTQATHVEDFVWQYGGTRIGRLTVPARFKVENYDYREGIVTTLVYQDGSRITLQSGGMYGLPLFKGAEYTLISTEELPAKAVRVGELETAQPVGERTTTGRRRQTENESACWRYSRRTSAIPEFLLCAGRTLIAHWIRSLGRSTESQRQAGKPARLGLWTVAPHPGSISVSTTFKLKVQRYRSSRMGYRLRSMSIADIAVEAAQLTVEERRRLLAQLAVELTIAARTTYVPGSEEIATPHQLRAFNEIQHRVTIALAENLRSGKGENWIWSVIADFAERAGIASDVAAACSLAFRSLPGTGK